jgi:ring-1,2-phenylacetyl-CoA epoxidase subunit PaaC
MNETALFTYTLRLADTALVLGHRLSEWAARGPTLEEDIALANLALDHIGQARLFYDYAGKVEGMGRDEDALAYLRDERDYRNLLIVEQPNSDFAATMLRQFLYSAFAEPYFAALASSNDATLAAIAAKAEKEMAYHLRHAGEWTIRLGEGTPESHARAQAALDDLAIYVDEFFEVDVVERELIEAGVAPDPQVIRASFDAALARAFEEATLALPTVKRGQSGGKTGRHTEHLGHLLAEMQSLHRAHPGVVW